MWPGFDCGLVAICALSLLLVLYSGPTFLNSNKRVQSFKKHERVRLKTNKFLHLFTATKKSIIGLFFPHAHIGFLKLRSGLFDRIEAHI